jgi:hypothetical protein
MYYTLYSSPNFVMLVVFVCFLTNYNFYDFFFFAVLGLKLRVFTLSHSTSPSFVKGFLR